jgi:hypothetical protein
MEALRASLGKKAPKPVKAAKAAEPEARKPPKRAQQAEPVARKSGKK